MTTKYSPTNEEVRAEREYVIEVPAANLLPLAMQLLRKLHNLDYAISDDDIEPIFVKGVFHKEKPKGFDGALLVLEILDGDEEPEDEVCENCVRCDARVYDDPADELCNNSRKDNEVVEERYIPPSHAQDPSPKKTRHNRWTFDIFDWDTGNALDKVTVEVREDIIDQETARNERLEAAIERVRPGAVLKEVLFSGAHNVARIRLK